MNTCRKAYSISVLLLLSFVCVTGIAKAEKRVALVIGNSAYTSVPKLNTPQNDAVAIGAVLGELGFDVVTALDLNEREMLRTFNDFSKKVVSADVALLFYAGHGLQVGGTNYLVPTDASLESEFDLQAQAMRLNLILNMMEHPNRTSIVLLDACRDNPMAKRLSRSMGTRSNDVRRGFARVSTGVGTYIGFSTEPGNVALDGDGKHSPFAKALLNNIGKENLDIESIMRLVRAEVYETTRGSQTPWGNSSLIGKGFFFNKSVAKVAAKSKDNVIVVPPQKQNNNAAEITYWNSIKDAKSLDLFQSYIDQYPKGLFIRIAKFNITRIEELEKLVQKKSNKITVAKLEEKNNSITQLEEVETKNTIRKIQNELNRLGCVAGKADGVWGKGSRNALKQYRKHGNVKLVSFDPTATLLEQLKTKQIRICPLICRSGFSNKNGKCVRIKREVKKEKNNRASETQITTPKKPIQKPIKKIAKSKKEKMYICKDPEKQAPVKLTEKERWAHAIYMEWCKEI